MLLLISAIFSTSEDKDNSDDLYPSCVGFLKDFRLAIEPLLLKYHTESTNFEGCKNKILRINFAFQLSNCKPVKYKENNVISLIHLTKNRIVFKVLLPSLNKFVIFKRVTSKMKRIGESHILEKLGEHENITKQILSNSVILYLYLSCGDVFENVRLSWIFFEYLEFDLGIKVINNMNHEKRMKDCMITKILFDVLNGLSHCHKKGLVHADIKESNVMGAIKTGRTIDHYELIDFGCSRFIHKAGIFKLLNPVGTHSYMAPEVINKRITLNSDIWSLGVMAYKLIIVPTKCNITDDVAKLLNGEASQLISKLDCFEEMKLFLNMCLICDYKLRPSADELLKHEIFNEHSEVLT